MHSVILLQMLGKLEFWEAISWLLKSFHALHEQSTMHFSLDGLELYDVDLKIICCDELPIEFYSIHNEIHSQVWLNREILIDQLESV